MVAVTFFPSEVDASVAEIREELLAQNWAGSRVRIV
jgi:hypothetical protein